MSTLPGIADNILNEYPDQANNVLELGSRGPSSVPLLVAIALFRKGVVIVQVVHDFYSLRQIMLQ